MAAIRTQLDPTLINSHRIGLVYFGVIS